jgi:hypothetical protein
MIPRGRKVWTETVNKVMEKHAPLLRRLQELQELRNITRVVRDTFRGRR